MRKQPLVLVADDNDDSREIVETMLTTSGYATATATDGEEAIARVWEIVPDLIVLDVMMPKLDGLEVCRRLRADSMLPFIPIVLVTAKSGIQDVVDGLEAGADDYLTKPVEHAALIARVQSMLRIKKLHDEVEAQKTELAGWNKMLQQRVAEQVREIERVGRLKRFLSPQVAELIVSQGREELLESHRAEVTVLFADLRRFTAFSELVEPPVVMAALAAFHKLAGPLINQYEGTLERFTGDGIMVLFNDPVPCPDPAKRAVQLALELRADFGPTLAPFQRDDATLHMGIGIAQGMATLGRIGFEGRFDYAAIGSVSNLASRLCSKATDGQILVSDEIAQAVAGLVRTTEVGTMPLKGFAAPVQVYDVIN